MAHAAALYRVRVKERYHDYKPLGDFDGNGSYLLDEVQAYLTDLQITDESGEKVLLTESLAVADDELIAMMLHGQSGVAADIVDQQRNPRLRQVDLTP